MVGAAPGGAWGAVWGQGIWSQVVLDSISELGLPVTMVPPTSSPGVQPLLLPILRQVC